MPISGSMKRSGYGKRGVLLLWAAVITLIFSTVCAPCAQAESFTLRLKRATSYVYINEKEMSVRLTIAGGTAPYEAAVSFAVGGDTKETLLQTCSEPGEYVFSRMPRKAGSWTITAEVTDAEGQTQKASVEIRGSTRSYEDEEEKFLDQLDRLKLTGDWRADLIAVAQLQLGVRESGSDYIVEGDGRQVGATRYGLWMDDPYSDWCASFIGYSMWRAEIPLVYDLGYAGVMSWLNVSRDMDAWRRSGYMPKAGDIVFLMPNGAGEISHIGIVEFATDTTIGTIEGNVADSVARRAYALDDPRIAGYASMEAMMDWRGVSYQEQAPHLYTVRDFSDRSGYVNRNKVNMRTGTDGSSERLFKELSKGTWVEIKAEITINDDRWFQAQYQGKIGYILAKYVDVDLSDLDRTDEPQEESPYVPMTFTVEEDGW